MLKAADDPSAAIFRPMLLTLIADQQLHAARIADAVCTLNQATAGMRVGDVRFYEAETIRLSDENSLAQSPSNAAKAETAFR